MTRFSFKNGKAEIVEEPDPMEKKAEDFLRRVLAGGRIPADTVWLLARKERISKHYILRAGTSLRRKVEKIDGDWYWSLPEENI